MSILIKGMEMPKSCYDCMLCHLYPMQRELRFCCEVINRAFEVSEESEMEKKRLSDCPLVEVLIPHGRLIDADELANKTFYSKTGAPYITYRKFVNAPTVIEAEGTE